MHRWVSYLPDLEDGKSHHTWRMISLNSHYKYACSGNFVSLITVPMPSFVFNGEIDGYFTLTKGLIQHMVLIEV